MTFVEKRENFHLKLCCRNTIRMLFDESRELNVIHFISFRLVYFCFLIDLNRPRDWNQ